MGQVSKWTIYNVVFGDNTVWRHVFTAWPVELMSDMLRVLVLWHWGGVYSDTDVICIRPYNLPLNSLGYETNFQIGSAVYSFRAHHPVVWRLMEDMTKGFEVSLLCYQFIQVVLTP